MKRILTTIVALMALAGIASAQPFPPPSSIFRILWANRPTAPGLGAVRTFTDTNCSGTPGSATTCQWNGSSWVPLPGASGSDDQTAAEVPNTPAGSIAATDVQAAINELDAEKAGLATNNNLTGTNTFSGALACTPVSPAEITADQNDYAGFDNNNCGGITLDANRTITSIANPTSGRWLEIHNNDDLATLTLEHESASGTAANRIRSVSGASLTVGPGQIAVCRYVSAISRWRCHVWKGYLTAETDEFQTLFNRDASGNVDITGVIESKKICEYGSGAGSDDGRCRWTGSDNVPRMQTVCNGVLNGCDNYDEAGASKKRGQKDSGGNIDWEYSEADDGFTRLTGSLSAEARGDLIYKGASKWNRLPAGTAGQFLQTQGAGADPVYKYPPILRDFDVVSCQGGVASAIWNTGIITAPTPICLTGTNRVVGVAQFPDADNDHGFYGSTYLPYTPSAVNATIFWRGTTSGNAVWQLATICVADTEADDAAFNAASNVVAASEDTATKVNKATISAVTITGCAGGENMRWKFFRNRTHASDTIGAETPQVEKLILELVF